MEPNTNFSSLDFYEESIYFEDDNEGRKDDPTREKQRGYDAFAAFPTPYRHVKVYQSAVKSERHLIKIPVSQLQKGGAEDEDDEEEEEDIIEERYKFTVFSSEEEPVLTTKAKDRSKKAFETIKKYAATEETKMETETKIPKEEKKKRRRMLDFKFLDKAAKLGAEMLPKMLFPCLSSVLQDIWVLGENGITLYQFVSSAQEFKDGASKPEVRAAMVFSSVALLLAAIDFFLYSVQMGSCAKLIRAVLTTYKPQKTRIKENEEEKEPLTEKKCVCINEKWKERLETWFEVGRSTLSELLLFPLLIFDLIGFISGSPYLLNNGEEDEKSVAFFVVSTCFFFVLSVYIMRLFMLLGTTSILTRMPLDICNSQKDTTAFVIRFSFTVVGQMVSQFMIIVAIGVKIKLETPVENAENVYISTFLTCLMLLGAVIPNFGLLTYFLVNYFDFKDFSIGIFINMMSMLQSESFAETVFGGEAKESVLGKAEELSNKLNVSRSRQAFDRKRSSPENTWSAKVMGAFKVPVLVFAGVVYYTMIIAFLALLAFTKNSKTGEVEFVLFRYSGLCIAFFLVAVALLVSNMYSLFIIHVWMLVALVMGFSTFLTFIFTCLWSLYAAIIFYFRHLVEIARDLQLI